jgi:hypothetical protein
MSEEQELLEIATMEFHGEVLRLLGKQNDLLEVIVQNLEK